MDVRELVCRTFPDEFELRLEEFRLAPDELAEALFYSAWHGQTDHLLALLSKGVNPNAISPKIGFSAVYAAIVEGMEESLLALISAGAEISSPDGSGLPPLQKAIEVECFLLSNGASEHGELVEGRCFIQLLLDAGADPKVRNERGETAMDFAVRQQCKHAEDLIRRKM